MRLINTSTLLLDEFFGDDIPKYAILSHTWTKDEVTFREWQEPTATTASKTGFLKVKDACALALSLAHEWLWADTACIDKTSSAELSEAINSMYAWYRNSAECLVYLADVEELDNDETQLQDQITASRWFTRGWTLQELLAPADLTFYDRRWRRLGTKTQYANAIALATGIPAGILKKARNAQPGASSLTVAQRMSWIACRRTTRIEDMAYCMLGIFDINMPLLYGEGAKAFLRLQHEILSTYHDHTILAWTWTARAGHDELDYRDSGVLARSPTAFTGMHGLTRGSMGSPHSAFEKPTPYSVTNLGLSIRLPTYHTARGLIAMLNARWKLEQHPYCHHYLAITLEKLVTQGTCSRFAFPNCALRFCTRLPIPPEVGLFLATQVDDPRWWATPRPPRAERLPATPDGYGLFLIFQNSRPGLGSHPPFCLNVTKSLLRFPSSPTAWKELSSAPGAPHLHVRSTAVVLCVSRKVFDDCAGAPALSIFGKKPDFSILFTVSIVTVQKTDELKRVVVFGDGVEMQKDWHPDPRAKLWKENYGSEPDNGEAEHHDPLVREILEVEMQQVFEVVTRGGHDLQACLEYWKWTSRGKSAVRVGRCDVGYPGFTEVRMALINLPDLDEKERGGPHA